MAFSSGMTFVAFVALDLTGFAFGMFMAQPAKMSGLSCT